MHVLIIQTSPKQHILAAFLLSINNNAEHMDTCTIYLPVMHIVCGYLLMMNMHERNKCINVNFSNCKCKQ